MIKKFDKTYIICILLALFRLWLGIKSMAMYNIDTKNDEAMMFEYSFFPDHFAETSDVYVMAKNMSFPIFLNFVHFSGLPYTMVLSLVWIADAFLGMLVFRKISTLKNRKGEWLSVFVFFIIAFAPCAFDLLTGTLLYRTAIIAPFALLFFLLLFLFVYKMLSIEDNSLQAPKKPPIILAIALGLLFGFNFYIQESGQWLFVLVLPSLAFALIFSLHKSKKVARKTIALRILCCALPLIIFAGYDLTYRAINYHYYGVFEINTRQGGEMGKFAQNLYKIKSDERTVELWAPRDAIEQAFEASETLTASPKFRETLLERNAWPPYGDFITWAIPDAIKNAGLWQSYAHTEAVFAQVNKELAAAFEDGTLEKTEGIQITASAPARTWDEIFALQPLVIQGWKSTLYADGYAVAETGDIDLADEQNMIFDRRNILSDYMTNMFLEQSFYDGFYKGERYATDAIEAFFIRLQQIIGLPLFLLGLVGFVFAVRAAVLSRRRLDFINFRKEVLRVVFMASLLLTAAVIIFGIAWFSDFLVSDSADIVARMKYYGVGAVPCILLFNIFGLSSLRNTISERQSVR